MKIGSLRRSGVALSAVATAALLGAGLLPGVISASSASTTSAVAQSAIRPTHKPTPKPTPTTPAPTATATPAPTTPLNPGPPPTSVPAGVTRIFLGVADSTDSGTVRLTVPAGRYTEEIDAGTLGGGFNTVVDGTFLQQTGLGGSQIGYSQTFQLSAGQHAFRLGGPEIYAPANVYLVGPL